MYATIVIVTIAYIWLLYETDWLQVRLLVGIEVPANGHKYDTWSNLKPYNPNFRQYPMWLTHPDNMIPLCGLDWLEHTMHIIPEYRIEVKAYGVTNKVTLKEPDSKLLKKLATSMFKPASVQRKEITAQRRLARARV